MKSKEQEAVNEHCKIRAMLFWGWTEFFRISIHPEDDPDFLNASELALMDKAVNAILLCSNFLCHEAVQAKQLKWKFRPKLHQMWHANRDSQLSHRSPSSFWTWKDEEMMGKLSRIACAVHANSMARRALQRWAVQFFNQTEGDLLEEDLLP